MLNILKICFFLSAGAAFGQSFEDFAGSAQGDWDAAEQLADRMELCLAEGREECGDIGLVDCELPRQSHCHWSAKLGWEVVGHRVYQRLWVKTGLRNVLDASQEAWLAVRAADCALASEAIRERFTARVVQDNCLRSEAMRRAVFLIGVEANAE